MRNSWVGQAEGGEIKESPAAIGCKINVNVLNKEVPMTLRTSDVVPISEARARLTELADEVVGAGAEKVLTKNGSSFVAIIDARKLDYYHALEQERASLVLLDEAEAGLRQWMAGQRVSAKELMSALVGETSFAKTRSPETP